MKKVILMMMMAAVVACSNSPQELELSQTEKDVIEYAREHVSKMVQDKDVTIEGIDTLLYDDSPYLNDEKWDSVITSYSKGKTTDKELSDYISNKTEHVAAVYTSWRRHSYDNEQLKGERIYEEYWHKVYCVSFGGSTIRVIMDSSGEKPIETEDDFCKRMNNKKVNTSPDGTPMFHF
jgi:hypothetical protein